MANEAAKAGPGLLSPHQVITRPMVTEKGMHRSTRYNAYAFEVNRLATKDDVLGVRPVPDPERFGIVELDGSGGIRKLVEKPAEPKSTLAATATYLFHRAHAPLVGRYLEEGNPPDLSGAFVEWLVPREPVYGYRFEGEWLDIGDLRQNVAAWTAMLAVLSGGIEPEPKRGRRR